MHTSDKPQSFRAAPSAYMVVGGTFWALVALFLAAAIMRPNAGGLWQMLALLALIGALLHAWLFAFRLELGEDWIGYRSLLQRAQIRLDDIASIDKPPPGARTHSKEMLPPFGVEIFLKSRPKGLPIVINLKVFSRDALAVLRDRLSAYQRA